MGGPGPSWPTCENPCLKSSATIRKSKPLYVCSALPSTSPRLQKVVFPWFLSFDQHPCLLWLQPVCLLSLLPLCLIIPREGPPPWAGSVGRSSAQKHICTSQKCRQEKALKDVERRQSNEPQREAVSHWVSGYLKD